MTIAASDSEKMTQNKAQPSPKTSDHRPTQETCNDDKGYNPPNAKPKDSRYPSPMRLTFLTVGLMAAVLMVALDNYILGLPSY